MSDKNNSVINNICATEQSIQNPVVGVDVIWPSSDYHENCLPVIGSCQVSSILSTLEHVQSQSESESEQKTSTENDTFKSIPINIINTDAVAIATDEVKKRNNKNVTLQRKQLFQEMMYFGCNLCPFICTKDSKISDHIQSVHKNQNNNNKKPQLKCPCCTNIFYHKLSLRSHLIHDHEVGRSDINKIVNSIVYVSVLQDNISLNEDDTKTTRTDFLNDNDVDYEQNFLENESDKSDDQNADYLPKQETNTDIPAITLIVNGIDETHEKTNDCNNIDNDMLNDIKDTKKNSKNDEPNKKNQKCYVSTCAVRMTELSNMAYHVKCHYGKIFRCFECNANFVIWKTLQTHLWRTHNIDMELYSCDKCNYKTYSLAKLNNIHKLIHGNEKSFLCDLCGKGYKNPKQLRNHKIIHKVKPPDKLLECDICKRTFTDKRILKIHIESVHQKLKPFSCNYCSYKAASNGALKLHVRLHTGQKPFSCDQCDYSTADHNSLRRHKSRHTNEKKYKCAHCDYACIQSSTYKTHLKTKHPGLENDLMFSCNLCQFRSVNKNKYLNHVAVHKDKKDQQDKFIDIIENICENRVQTKKPEVEFINLKAQIQEEFPTDQKLILPKKTTLHEFQNMEINLQETPVALISKMETESSHCIILPVQNDVSDNTLQNVQYFYNAGDVVLEIIDDKPK